jgi:gas vesicle protein
MADSYDRYDSEGSGGGFMMGLLTGTVLGAGLGMLLAPKAGADLRGALGEQARNLGSMANEQYRKASEAAGGWGDKGREFVDKAREAVTRGVEDARGFAGNTTGSSTSGFGGSGSGGSGSSGSGGFGGSSAGTSGGSGSSFGGSTGSTGSTGTSGTGSTGGFGGSGSGSDFNRS